jgi:hypothetical protein
MRCVPHIIHLAAVKVIVPSSLILCSNTDFILDLGVAWCYLLQRCEYSS